MRLAAAPVTGVVDAKLRERVGRGIFGSEKSLSGVPKGPTTWKAIASPPKRQWGDGGGAPGGVVDSGTLEEDGPKTWEIPNPPRDRNGRGAPYPKLPQGRARQGAGVHACQAIELATNDALPLRW